MNGPIKPLAMRRYMDIFMLGVGIRTRTHVSNVRLVVRNLLRYSVIFTSPLPSLTIFNFYLLFTQKEWMTELLRSKISDHKPNITDMSSRPNTHTKHKNVHIPTHGQGFYRSVHYSCLGFTSS
jgi:hypothetical protein